MPITFSRLVPSALALALTLGACSSVSERPAATVNGDTITSEALEAELLAIRGNERYRQGVEQSLAQQGLQISVRGDGEGSFDSAFVARLLSLNVYYQLLEQQMAERGLQITSEDLEAIRPQAINAVGGEEVFAAFPIAFQDQLVRRQALTLKLRGAVAGDLDPGLARQFYDQNPDEFTGVCVSHIFASKQQRGPDDARSRIEDLARQLAEGADFTALATEQSDDATAAAQGGSLGCGGRGRFIPEFEQAAFAIPVGQVSEPVESSVGFHLILVTERRTLPFEEVQGQVEQALQRRQIEEFGAFVDDLTCTAEVEVNPRYGDWRDGCDDPAQVGQIEPPEGPATPSSVPAQGGSSEASG